MQRFVCAAVPVNEIGYRPDMRPITASSALVEAAVTMLAAIASLASVAAIDADPGAMVLAVVLCVSLSRRQLEGDARTTLEVAITVPLIGLFAVGVGLLLHHARWLGACVFTAGLFVSIWLRRFGPWARRAATIIALPFVTILVTPYVPATRSGVVPPWLVPVLVALIAMVWVTLLHALARRTRWLPGAERDLAAQEATSPAPKSESGMRPDPLTRMAIQMAVAVGASFVVGYLFFPERWSWIVLTAFIVISGNRGRLDVAYKSVLRVLGAAAGTIAALTFATRLGAHDSQTVTLIIASVFLGLWLRPFGYAWWALFVTLALALLQGFMGAPMQHILWPRLEEIVIGALIAVAAAWFVLPVRSTGVLRRRIADALAALSEALDPARPTRTSGAFVAALARVEQVAPAFRASRLVTRHLGREQPADWVDALIACRDPAVALIDSGATPPGVRKSVGAARKALREPKEIPGALRDLQAALAG
jgi:hypothetical protein